MPGAGSARGREHFPLASLEVLTQRLPNLRVVPDQKLTYFPSATARRLESLELEWDAE